MANHRIHQEIEINMESICKNLILSPDPTPNVVSKILKSTLYWSLSLFMCKRFLLPLEIGVLTTHTDTNHKSTLNQTPRVCSSRCHRPAQLGRQWARDLPSTGPHCTARYAHSRSAQRSRPTARWLAPESAAVSRFFLQILSMRVQTPYISPDFFDFTPLFVHECVVSISIAICLMFVCLFFCLHTFSLFVRSFVRLLHVCIPRESIGDHSCLIITIIMIITSLSSK